MMLIYTVVGILTFFLCFYSSHEPLSRQGINNISIIFALTLLSVAWPVLYMLIAYELTKGANDV